jgi:exosortase A
MHVEPQIAAHLRAASGAPRAAAVLAVLACIAWLFVWYGETTLSMVAIWARSDTFAHGFVVAPIVGYLVWRERAALARLPIRPWPPALLGLVAAGLAWLVGEAASAVALSQFALVAMVPFVVWGLLGTAIARALAFPLAFLFFAVPFGDFLVPTLIDWTAEFTIGAIRLSGIPIFREGNHFQIPTGRWSVVEACSGIRYLIASFMVGCLYAYLTYRSLRRRLVFIGFSLLVPILANWLRAYLIVMIGHLSGNRLAVGVDHLVYGWLFFGIVIGIMFFVGARWREDLGPAGAPAASGSPAPGWRPDARFAGALAAALALVTVWPPAYAALESRHAGSGGALAAVDAAGGWRAEGAPVSAWRPGFENPAFERRQAFARDGRRVGLYVAYYRQQSQESELVSWQNQLVRPADERWRKTAAGLRDLAGAPDRVRTAELVADDTRLLAWQWFWVGGRLTASEHLAKLYIALDRLTGRGDDAAVVVVYTPMSGPRDAQAAGTLAAFVSDMGPGIEARLAAARGPR